MLQKDYRNSPIRMGINSFFATKARKRKGAQRKRRSRSVF
jgi:hypothetical protein